MQLGQAAERAIGEIAELAYRGKCSSEFSTHRKKDDEYLHTYTPEHYLELLKAALCGSIGRFSKLLDRDLKQANQF